MGVTSWARTVRSQRSAHRLSPRNITLSLSFTGHVIIHIHIFFPYLLTYLLTLVIAFIFIFMQGISEYAGTLLLALCPLLALYFSLTSALKPRRDTSSSLSPVPQLSPPMPSPINDPTHQHVFHFTPKHGSWLNQFELWFSVLARRFLKRGDYDSAHDFEARLSDSLEVYNTHHAHPYRWTYTGQPLVRATPFSQTRRQQRHGRAWFSSRSKRFERALYPPRPYKRSAA